MPDPDDDVDPDEDDDDEDEDDEDDGDDNGDEDEEPEDSAQAAPHASSEPLAAAVSPVAAVPVFSESREAAIAAHRAPEDRAVDRAARFVADADRAGRVAAASAPALRTGRFKSPNPFLDITDPQLTQLDVRTEEWNPAKGKKSQRHICRLKRPFPPCTTWREFATWLRSTFGGAKYLIVQRGAGGYISSRTIDLSEGIPVAQVTEDLNPNGAAAVPIGNGSAPAVGAPSAPGQYAGMDYRTALVVVGIPALTTAVTAFAAALAKRPPDTSLDRILEVVKLAQVTNAERSELFKQAMELSQSIERAQTGAGTENPAALGDLSSLANSVAEIIKALKPNTPTPAAPSPPALTSGSPPAATTPAQRLELMIVSEIERAVAQADEPECLVLILESWLDSASLAWLTETDEATVLAELPSRYATYGDYLKQEPVQNFLRRALAMLREDAESEEGPQGDRAPASIAAPA